MGYRLRRAATGAVVSAGGALLTLGLGSAAANATPGPAVHAPRSVYAARATPAAACHHCVHYRQLIGTVTASTYLEASVPTAGTYAIEYDITTTSAAFFDTYLNGTELGYVGGVTGRYVTRTVQLTAGGQLVQVGGPDGVGTADVYLISVCTHHRK